MAKKNFQFEKYKREQAQQKKSEEKARKKQEKRAKQQEEAEGGTPEPESFELEQTEASAEGGVNDDSPDSRQKDSSQ